MEPSSTFSKLKDQVENADRSIREAVARDAAELKETVDEARERADKRAAELRAKGEAASDDVERQWHQVQSDWDDHVKRLRSRIDARKAEHEANRAELDAEVAEADAVDAVEFASAAIEEAQYAVLDAVLARRNADITAAAI
jgi:hypothetical protein